MVAPQAAHIRSALEAGEVYIDERLTADTSQGPRIFHLTVYPLRARQMEGAVLRFDDITEKLRLDALLIRSEKMVSVAGLAAGVAHEINNPLSAVLQSAQLVQERLTLDTPQNRKIALEAGTDWDAVAEYAKKRKLDSLLQETRRSGERAARIVRNLLTFSRSSDEYKEQIDLHQIIENAIELLLSEYDAKKKFDFRRIRILREYDPALPLVTGIAVQLQQVFMNILSNGAHAMLEAEEQSRGEQFVIRTTHDERSVIVEIEDNGPGMDEDTLRRAFEPFFTTKQAGDGTGLGLYICYFLITEHHWGELEVVSNAGKGAKFVIKLPQDSRRA